MFDVISFVVRKVRAMRSGESLTFYGSLFKDVQPFEYNGARWRPEEQVLERIVGSAYEYDVSTSLDGDITFYRNVPAPEGFYRYVSPDRRHLVTLGPDGLYKSKVSPGE